MADQLTEFDVADQPRVQPADWGGGDLTKADVGVRSPANVAIAVATTGRIGFHGEPGMRY